jgi:hypothetical protein
MAGQMWFDWIGYCEHFDVRLHLAKLDFIQKQYPVPAILRSNVFSANNSFGSGRGFPSNLLASSWRITIDMLRCYNGQLAGHLSKSLSRTGGYPK